MDEITHLKCDVELNLTGPDIDDVNKLAAQELRKLASRIENDEFGDGFHTFASRIGVAVGEVYMDYSGSPATSGDVVRGAQDGIGMSESK